MGQAEISVGNLTSIYIYIYNLTSGVLQDCLAEGHFLWQGSQCLRNLKQVYTYIYICVCVCVCVRRLWEYHQFMGISPVQGNITSYNGKSRIRISFFFGKMTMIRISSQLRKYMGIAATHGKITFSWEVSP